MYKSEWSHADDKGNKIIRTKDGKYIIFAVALDYNMEFIPAMSDDEALIYFTAYIRGIEMVYNRSIEQMETIIKIGLDAYKKKFCAHVETINIGTDKKIQINITESDDCFKLSFSEMPDVETRNIMKSNGFRWNPKTYSWDISISQITYEELSELFI